ncbi:MAG: NRDE family protein [Burkholderiales bacterium]|nr:NRDE family protein [Burkholderiales bacterium]
MCLIAFALHTSPQVGLLLAANRDEALDRPTQPLHRWHTPAGVSVIGGRDGRDHGTWLACAGPDAPPHAANRVAMLTNVRHGQDTTTWPRSRGELPLLWLNGTPLDTLTSQLDPSAFGAFNLVVGNVATGQWHWLTNRDAQHRTALRCQALPAGVYGLSNAGLNTPWPKTVALRTALETALTGWQAGSNANELVHLQAQAALWAKLADRQTWPDADLPATGVPIEWERSLSAIWVDHPPAYGTRTSALLSVTRTAAGAHQWDWHMQERTWRPGLQQGLRAEKWTTIQ